ncbi:MAG: hypothetical protein JO254_08025, partial [Pseudolabrys sp.]|nr:hypothetical protein [Pseudolabrys sp.]
MPARPIRIAVRFGAAAAVFAAASSFANPVRLPNAQIEPLTFAALDGWADDDHVAAYGSFFNSCKAILKGTKAMRRGKPIYAGLFEVCLRAS